MSDRTRSLIPVETLHETDESKVDLLATLCGTGASRNCSTVRCRSGVFVGQLNASLRHRQQSPPRSLPQLAEKSCPQSVLEARCWKPSWCTIVKLSAERSFGSKTEFAYEVQLATLSNSLPTWGRDISTIRSNARCWKLSRCTIFAIWTSWNVAGLLGGSPQSAILSSVSQRNAVGKVEKIVQLIVGDSGVDRGFFSLVCVHILPSRPLELNRQKH